MIQKDFFAVKRFGFCKHEMVKYNSAGWCI